MEIIKSIKMLNKIVGSGVIAILIFIASGAANSHTALPSGPPPGPFPEPPPCPTNQCCDKSGAGGKIIFRSGSETTRVTDMEVKGVQSIKLSRTYTSDTFYDSHLGYGWAFQHDQRLFEYPDNSIVVRHGCGNTNRFIYTGGAYQPASGSQNLSLNKRADGSFTLHYPNGEWQLFGTQGRLISKYDIKGNRHDYIYDSRGNLPLIGASPNTIDPSRPITVAYMPRLTRIESRLANTNTLDGYIDFDYNDVTGRLVSATANDGRSITYEHDVAADSLTKGNLVKVNGLEGKVSTYKYEDIVDGVYQDHHNLTYIQEGLDATPYEIEYDIEGRAYRETRGYKVLEFDYSQLPLFTTVTETITDDVGGNIRTAVSEYHFDAAGFVEFIKDPLGNETRYTLDNFGNKVLEEQYQGSEAAGDLHKSIERSFDSNNNLLAESVTLQSGEVITTSYTYDGHQKATKTVVSSLDVGKEFRTEWVYNHDADGQTSTVREERRYKDNGVDRLTTSYTYNDHGNVLTTTLPDGHVIVNEYGTEYAGKYITRTRHQVDGVFVNDLSETYTYDGRGNRLTVTDAKGHTTTTTYDDLDRRETVTNELGHLTSYSYDARGNLSKVVRDRSVPGDQLDITRLTYDAVNHLRTIERSNASGAFVTLKTMTYDSAGNLYSSTNSIGQTTRFSYDLLHRLTGITNYKNESITYTLDVFGNHISKEIRDSSGVTVKSSDASYDALNRQLTQIGGSNSQTTTYSYDAMGNRTRMIDALSRPATVYTYNTLSQLTNIEDAAGNNTQYAYHDRGWLETVTDPRGLATNYNYNELGQLEQLTSPDTGITTYSYDNAGNKATKTDARGVVTTYNYDELNRLSQITYPDTSLNVSFTYDENHSANSYGLGKLTTMTDASGSTQYEYNHWGDLVKETRIISGLTFTTMYSYDTEHRLMSTIYPSGRVVTHATDDNNDIVSLSSDYQSSSQAILSNMTYMPFGGLDTASLGNGLPLNHEYDQDYRLTQQQVGTAYDRTTVYNDVNNISDIINNLDAARNQSFVYDDLGRLTDATGVYGQFEYGYDEDGNRTTETFNGTDSSTYDYPVDSNRLDGITGAKATSLSYDDNGNTQTKNGITFSYQQNNRMSAMTNDGVNALYTYDGKGQRVIKNVNGDITLFIYDKDGKLIAEADATGAIQKDYIYFAGKPAAMATTGTSAETYYYHVDHLGTPQVLTDQSQAVVWSANYEPFGEVALTTSTVENNLRFPGQYYDGESGLHYNYFRDYDPGLGRYITSDPIGLGGGLNTYAYVLSNPIYNLDPLGLKCCTMQTQVDMDCVLSANNKFGVCTRFNMIMQTVCQLLCVYMPELPGRVCSYVCVTAYTLDTANCREWLQEDLKDCTKEVCI